MSGEELGPLSRGLLDAARGGMGPDADAAARVRAKIAIAVGAGVVVAAGIGASKTASAAAAAKAASGAGATAGAGAAGTSATGAATALSAIGKMTLLAKIGTAIVVASAVSGGGYAVHAQLTASAPAVQLAPAPRAIQSVVATAPPRAGIPYVPVPPPSVVVAEPAPPVEPVPDIEVDPTPTAHVVQPHVAARAIVAAAPAAPVAPVAEPAPAPVVADEAPAPAPPPAPASVPVLVNHANLAREVELVDHAILYLRRGESWAALQTLRLYASETGGKGQLAEDADAIELEALCRTHDPHMAARLADFDRKWPGSIARGRSSVSCDP